MSDRRPPSEPELVKDEALRRALGKAIGIRRLELGLKRNDLRDRSGLSYPYIAELENGTKRGSTKALYALASALEVSVSELLERAELLRDQEEDDAIALGPAAGAEGSGREESGWFSRPLPSAPTAARVMSAPDPREPYGGRTRYPSRSRSPRVEVDLDELRQLVRQVVREEVGDAVRDAIRESLAERPRSAPESH